MRHVEYRSEGLNRQAPRIVWPSLDQSKPCMSTWPGLVRIRSPLPSVLIIPIASELPRVVHRENASFAPSGDHRGLIIRQSALESSESLPSFGDRSLPQLAAACPDGAIGDLRAVGLRVEIHLSRAAVANRIRFTGDMAPARIEWEGPKPRSARRRREDNFRAVPRNGDVRLFACAGRQPFGAIDPFLRDRIDSDAPDVLGIARQPLEIDDTDAMVSRQTSRLKRLRGPAGPAPLSQGRWRCRHREERSGTSPRPRASFPRRRCAGRRDATPHEEP